MKNNKIKKTKFFILTAMIIISSIFINTAPNKYVDTEANATTTLIYTEVALTMYKLPGKGKYSTKLKAGIYKKYATSGKWTKVKNNKSKYVWINKTKKLSTKYASKYANVEKKIIVLVNKERNKVGLKSLKVRTPLKKYTNFRSEEMMKNNYFGHTSPIYGRWVNLLYTSEYNFDYAGENLAAGFVSAQDFVDAWMASPTHRKNILNPNYTKTSVSVIAGKSSNQYKTYATQWFEQ